MIQNLRPLIHLSLLITVWGCFGLKMAAGQDEFKIHTQDVFNFWEAYDSLLVNVDTPGIFQRLVINRASEPFRLLIKKGNITAQNYTAQIRKYPKFYQSIRSTSLKLVNSEREIRLLVAKLKDIYSPTIPVDICIGFGNFYTGGTIYVDNKTRLVYIGLEYHGLDSSTVISEFNGPMKEYLSRSNFFRTIIHELVHVQQVTHGRAVKKSYYGDKLIHSILREGVADFIGKLIFPGGNDGKYVEYGLQNEVSLKTKLKDQLWQSDKSYWIYNSKPTDGQPADVGYFMGSRIANAFYQKNKGNPDVTRQIIEITDVKEFVDKSGYFLMSH